MKSTFLSISLVAILALSTLRAEAYNSAVSGDPGQGFVDVETKVAVKSATAGYSDAISKGHAVFYENAALTGLYTVSRDYSGTYNTALATRLNEACIASKDVATGDVGGFPCVVRGYVDYAIYSAEPGTYITAGDYLCISDVSTSKGHLVKCGSGITSKFIAIEDKVATVSGGTMKVKVNEH